MNQKGQVIFTKDVGTGWHSKYTTHGPTTPQGDVRSPMAVFGEKFSRYLGFEIVSNGEKVVFKAPGAKLLKDRLVPLNFALKKLGYEPFSYLPVSAGFASPEEMGSPVPYEPARNS